MLTVAGFFAGLFTAVFLPETYPIKAGIVRVDVGPIFILGLCGAVIGMFFDAALQGSP